MDSHVGLSGGALRRPFDRRSLLLGSVGLLGASLVGCSSDTPEASPSQETVPLPSYDPPFFIAHRGGGSNWPEGTLYAYEQAAKIDGLTGLEVSVHETKDGVLVCHHDANTGRLSQKDLVIEDSYWADLKGLTISGAETRDPKQAAQPIARLDDLLDSWPDELALWIEPKVMAAADATFEMLERKAPPSVTWKQPINSPLFARAKAAGYDTWGYVLEGKEQMRFLDQVVDTPEMDRVGININDSDERITEVVEKAKAAGKQVVSWKIVSTEQYDRGTKLGIDGFMTSDIVAVVKDRQG